MSQRPLTRRQRSSAWRFLQLQGTTATPMRAWTLVASLLVAPLLLSTSADAQAATLYDFVGPLTVDDNGLGENLPGMSVTRDASATGTLYLRFQVDPTSDFNDENYYAGLQLFQGPSTERLGIGNAFGAFAYSAFAATPGEVDFNSATPEPGFSFQFVRNTDSTTFVVRIDYNANAADDVTVWLDPDPALTEAEQPANLRTTFTADATFDEIRLREGLGDAGWTFSRIRIDTDFSQALFPDQDGDGFSDWDDADIDGDGIPNGVEEALGLNPLSAADAAQDLDEDGFSNLAEYELGTGIDAPGATPLGQANRHQKLFASDGVADDELGSAVAVSGDTAVIAAVRAGDVGAAYVYVRQDNRWVPQAKLTASDAETSDNFGSSVALSGDTAVVGAAGKDSFDGAAYVFTRTGDTWTQQAKLTAGDVGDGDRFGISVSVSGDTVAVGADRHDTAPQTQDSGAVYVFQRTGDVWNQQAKLTAADGAQSDRFGFSAAVDGDTAVVGAHRADNDAGAAYVFTRAGAAWTQQAKLTASDAAANDRFAFSVSLSGDTALIGAYRDNDNGSDSGSAYVFTRTGAAWTQQAKLIATDEGIQDDEFGYSVSVSGPIAVVGAYAHDNSAGTAYVFLREGTAWRQLSKITAADAASGDYFGISVAVGDTAVVAGAVADDDLGNVSGSAYVFDLDTDGDGLLNQLEIDVYGTDHLLEDSDEDGLLDGFEIEFGFDPLGTNEASQDNDGDGLDNLEEQTAGSNPRLADTDRDGFPDDAEFVLGTDPADPTSSPVRYPLTASDGMAGDQFGSSVAVDGTTAIVGAPLERDSAGAAYVFERQGLFWQQQSKFASGSVRFGTGVALSGNTAAIARGSGAGEVAVFTRDGTTWLPQTLLSPPVDPSADEFGNSLSLSGNTLAIGAGSDALQGGSAYVFVLNGDSWTQQAKLKAPEGEGGFGFFTVALSGDTLVAGSWDPGSAGSAFVFVRNGADWTWQATLTPADSATDDAFGASVTIVGDIAVIGASGAGPSGAAYVFSRNGTVWSQQAKLSASDAAAGDNFGASVSLSGTRAVVGAPDAGNAGAAYLFAASATGWTQQAKLTASAVVSGARYGSSVSLSGDITVIGVPLDDALGSESGSGFAIDLDTDDDGLFDQEELDVFNTNPILPDTDGDGLSDAEEVNAYGTDPVSPDTDGDGFSDGEEVSGGTDPNDAADCADCGNPLLLIIPMLDRE